VYIHVSDFLCVTTLTFYTALTAGSDAHLDHFVRECTAEVKLNLFPYHLGRAENPYHTGIAGTDASLI
jgi:hypothetical protein